MSAARAGTDFWRGRRVFVTGHTGFKGTWLCLWLTRMGAKVTGYALAPDTSPNLYQASGLGQRLTSHIADVRDFTALSAALGAVTPEVVFHLAAQPLVRLSYREPRETYETNVMGTVNLLEACRAVPGIQAIVSVTSDKCYQNRELGEAHTGYVEDDPMGGDDPYSNSKGCAELVTHAYRRSFFADAAPRLASARAGNVIGGGDWCSDRLVPDFVRALQGGEALLVRNPHATRPWQHVLEPLSGYLALAEALCGDEGARFASGWNFGPQQSEARSVAWVADTMVRLVGKGASWQDGSDPAAPHEARFLKLDSSRAAEALHWRARLTTEEALAWTMAWYQAAHAADWTNAGPLCEKQIEAYEAR